MDIIIDISFLFALDCYLHSQFLEENLIDVLIRC